MKITYSAQRLALAAVGGRVDSPSKRKKLKARKMLKKRGAYPKSASKIREDTADRPSADPREIVVQLGSPCPHLMSPNSWKVLKTVY
jgi:hypothetical protein